MSLKQYVGRGAVVLGLLTIPFLSPGCGCERPPKIENNYYYNTTIEQSSPTPSQSYRHQEPQWKKMNFPSPGAYDYYKDTNIGPERPLREDRPSQRLQQQSGRQHNTHGYYEETNTGPHRELRR